MKYYYTDKSELQRLIKNATREAIKNELPSIIRKVNRKQWLTTGDVMAVLKCTRPHVQYLRDQGMLPYRQHGRLIRYKINEVEAYLNKKETIG